MIEDLPYIVGVLDSSGTPMLPTVAAADRQPQADLRRDDRDGEIRSM